MKNKKIIILLTALILITSVYLFYNYSAEKEGNIVLEDTVENRLKLNSSEKNGKNTGENSEHTETDLENPNMMAEENRINEEEKDKKKKVKDEVVRKAIYTFKNSRDPFFKDLDTEKENIGGKNNLKDKNNIENKTKDNFKVKSQTDTENTEKKTEKNKDEDNEKADIRKEYIEIPFILKGIVGDENKRYAVISYGNKSYVKEEKEKAAGFLIKKIKDRSIKVDYKNVEHEMFIWRSKSNGKP
ncbi:MAG: hypothetical protein ACQESS_08400 [Bacillota bacterium]